jgi:hypothetical protein
LAEQGPPAQVPEDAIDPLPLRRLLVEPKQVPAQLEKVRRGVLTKLSREDFEARVRKAARAAAALKNPPRLLAAHYRATLKGQALDGKGDWTLLNPTKAGILPLPELNLALRNVKLGAADAILGDLDGKSLGLLVKSAGKQAVVFDWTARGDPRSDGLYFKLQAPPCAVASLDLTLPQDCVVRLSPRNQGALTRLSGEKEQSHWQIRFSGRSEINLVIHQTSGAAPLVLTRLKTEQELTPGRVEARFDFQVEVLHNIARTLYFACDPSLTPEAVRVQASNRPVDHTWKLHKSSRPGLPHVLAVELQEPLLGTLAPLSIKCRGPLAAGKPWTSPGLSLVAVLPWGKSTAEEDKPAALSDPRLVKALPRGEELTLLVHPEVSPERWQPGNFRLGKTEVRSNDFQALTLTGEGTRPSFFVPRLSAGAAGSGCLARQFTRWQVSPRGATLTAQITYQIARGRLFQFRLGLPAGWEVEQVELDQDEPGTTDLLRSWAPLEEQGRPVLVVELQQALLPRVSMRLTVHLHAARAPVVPAAGLALDFPDVEPLDARFRTGALAIAVDPLYQAAVAHTSTAATLPEETVTDRTTPNFYFPFRIRRAEDRGSNNKAKAKKAPTIPRDPPSAIRDPRSSMHPAVTGKLLLRPRPARLRVHCTTEVVLAPERASGLLRLHLDPAAGRPESIDLYLSAPLPGPWKWQTEQGSNRVRQTVPLLPQMLGLGANGGVGLLPLLAASPRGQWWRVTFAQPLQGPLTLQTSFPLPAPGEQAGPVPLPTVPAADTQEGEVTLYLAGTGLVEVKTQGLRETPVAARAAPAGGPGGAALAWRTYRYGRSLFADGAEEAAPLLSLSRRAQAAGQAPEEVIDLSRLTTYVEPHGRLLHHFAFRAWHWRRRTLTVRLPAGAQPLAVKAYGRWVNPLARAETEGGAVLELQVAAGVRMHRFEVVYASPRNNSPWALWSRLEAPVPSLPVRPVSFRRIWRLPPGVLPLTRGGQRRLPGFGGQRGLAEVEFFPGSDLHREAQNLHHQRELLAEADAALRRQLVRDRSWRLGEVLNRLVFDRLQGQTVLVLDAEALREAGLTPASPLASRRGERGTQKSNDSVPVWERWDLVYIPCREGALLTTRQQEEIWQDTTGQTAPPAAVEEAVGEAAVYGHDGSGRFRAGADWLREYGDRGSRIEDREEKGFARPTILDPYADWTAWEPVAGLEGEEVLWVVRQEGLLFLGLAVAGALGGAAWGVRRLPARRRLRLLLALLAGLVLALVWLPPALRELAWWPALAALAGLVLWYVVATVMSQFRAAPAAGTGKGASGSAVKAATLLALVGVTSLAGHAAAPAPATVLLVPDSGAAGKLSALVTPDLLQRLEALSRQGVAGLQGAVLLSADSPQCRL